MHPIIINGDVMNLTACLKSLRLFFLYLIALAMILPIISSCNQDFENSDLTSSEWFYSNDSQQNSNDGQSDFSNYESSIGASSIDYTSSCVESGEISNETSKNDQSDDPSSIVPNESKPIEESIITHEPGSKKDHVIYLTFDDGPSPKQTAKLLNILAEHDIKATFFVVGVWAKKYPNLIKRMNDEGHIIASHSMTHGIKKIYKSVNNFESDLNEWEETIKNILGKLPDTLIYRFPGGSSSAYLYGHAKEILDVLDNKKYYIYDWTASNGDKWLDAIKENEKFEDYLKRMLLETVHQYDKKKTPCIVLMHDSVVETLDMVDWALCELEKEGYTFDTLNNLNKSYLFPHK